MLISVRRKASPKNNWNQPLSYRSQNLRGIRLTGLDVTAWDFRGQDLTGADLRDSNLTIARLNGADLRDADLSGSTVVLAELNGADLRNANLVDTDHRFLPWAMIDTQTVYNQWTKFFYGFDPQAAGLTFVASAAGDLDANDALDAVDVDALVEKMRTSRSRPSWLPDAAYDLNQDGMISEQDHGTWVKDLKHTWFGDADLDGEFNSNDFVQVFTVGKYETAVVAGWAEGDWDASGTFDSSDFVVAFTDGGYDEGPRTDVAAVPEPSAWTLLVIGLVLWLFGRRTCAT